MAARERQTESAGVPGNYNLVRPVAVSVVVGAAVSALLLFVMAFILSSRTVPQVAVDPMASVSLAGGAFAAGLCCAKLTRRRGLLYGFATGAVLTGVVLLAGLLLGDDGFGLPVLFKLLFLMLPAMLGGVLGVNARR